MSRSKKKTVFDFTSIYLYSWEDLYWMEDEIYVGLEALTALLKNQEDTLAENFKKTEDLRKQKLPQIPEEFRASYEQQFFENDDKVNYQLRIVQRYSLCLAYFTFLENRLEVLSQAVANEFDLHFEKNPQNILPNLMNFLRDDFGLNYEKIEPHFIRIINQRFTRNCIAHNQGQIAHNDLNKFQPATGLGLKNNSIIMKPIYLEYLIKLSRCLFEDLLVEIDKRYIELKKGDE